MKNFRNKSGEFGELRWWLWRNEKREYCAAGIEKVFWCLSCFHCLIYFQLNYTEVEGFETQQNRRDWFTVFNKRRGLWVQLMERHLKCWSVGFRKAGRRVLDIIQIERGHFKAESYGFWQEIKKIIMDSYIWIGLRPLLVWKLINFIYNMTY